MKNKHNHRESGYTMIGVLIIFAIITVLGLSIVTLSFASIKTSTTERDNQSAFYIAEAGLTYQMAETEQKVMEIYESDQVYTEEDFFKRIKELVEEGVEYNDFEKVNGVQPLAEVSIDLMGGTDNQFIMESTGKIGKQERTVRQSFSVVWEEKYTANGPYELPPFAVFTSGKISIPQGHINGDIGTLYTVENGVSFPNSGATHIGRIYVPGGKESNIVKIENSKITSEIKPIDKSYSMVELPPFPEIPADYTKLPDQIFKKSDSNSTDLIKDNQLLILNWMTNNYSLIMNDNLEFKSIEINQNNTLNINVGNTDRSIVVDHLNLTNGHIKLEGAGKLTIYVRNKITTGAGSTINDNGNINSVNIFFKGTNKVQLDGNQKIYGSIYVDKAELYLTASGGIRGNIFTGGNKIKLSGGSNVETQLILAPYAEAKVEAGGNMEGMIISKTFTNQGGAKIIYGEPFVLDGPISPAALGMENGNGSEGPGWGGGTEKTGNSPTITTTPPREVNN